MKRFVCIVHMSPLFDQIGQVNIQSQYISYPLNNVMDGDTPVATFCNVPMSNGKFIDVDITRTQDGYRIHN